MLFKPSDDLALKAHAELVKQPNYGEVQQSYLKSASSKSPNGFMALLSAGRKSTAPLVKCPVFKKTVNFFFDKDGVKPINIYHPNYRAFLAELEETFRPYFVEGRSYCKHDEIPDFSKVLTNHPNFIAYPYQVSMGHDNGKSWDVNERSEERQVIDLYLGLILRKQYLSDFTVPKKSSLGAPFLNKGPKAKLVLLRHNIKYFDRLSNICYLVNEGRISNKVAFDRLYNKHYISSIALQGLRISNDKHGSTGKTRKFTQFGHTFSTIVAHTDLPGFFRRRARIVIGHNYAVNGLTNLVLVPIRNFYYKEYEATYKVRSSLVLSSQFQKCCYIFGMDVTQLDNNTASSRVDYYHSKIINLLKTESDDCYPKRAYQTLFNLSSHPSVYFRSSSYDKGFYCNGNPMAIKDDVLFRDNPSIGIPSGISSTSELGKWEVTSFVLIIMKRIHDKFELLKESKSVLKGFRDFLEFEKGRESIIGPDHKTSDIFIDPVSRFPTFAHFVHHFLNNHLDGEFVIKNTGDDTVLGTSHRYLFFFFCVLVALRKTNDEPSSKLFTTIPPLKEVPSCDWHIIDAEEPLSYLGNLLYKCEYPTRWEFRNNPASFITNTILPEQDIRLKSTWGIGYIARCDVYSNTNPHFRDFVLPTFERIFAKHFFDGVTTPTNVAKAAAGEYKVQMISSMNLSGPDAEFINNPDVIYYKYSIDEINSNLIQNFFEFISKDELRPFYNKIFLKEVMEL